LIRGKSYRIYEISGDSEESDNQVDFKKMDYNKDVDDNFDNFYFMNGQVVSLVICGLSRLGLMAGRNVHNSDQFIK